MTRRPAGRFLPIIGCTLILAGCGGDDMPAENRTGPVRIEGQKIRDGGESALTGTPMNERVAVIGLLNKRNGITTDLQMKPGEALRVGDAIVRLQACETTAPWENVQETGAFVQLDVRSTADNKWRRNFSGWLFRERPDRNVVQHPIYDVWVRSCTMSWPETGPDTVKLGDKGEASAGGPAQASPASGENASSAQTPEPPASTPRPAPSATPSSATAND
ncbi:Protein of unknown function DUF2155 [Sphingobium chlorophenolicum L-1]|uniref:DUF2155 domain-containing protein n=1 Tax=Sphingobium chlorophenolicum L-1 TaxID=690566 RepID=F6F018_SPHCR|nr:Protein of unknown function DUF2155 [Sphingobium chlorophenolicum L-1]